MSHDTRNPRRSGRAIAATAAIIAVAALTLGPRALVAPARGAFMQAMDVATAPLLTWIPYGDAERVLNTLLFIPLGATVAMVLGRRWWGVAILAGFAMSVTVEYAQGVIPGRVPDGEDVLWNTVGAAIGVLAATLVRVVARSGNRAAQARAAAVTGSVTRT